MLRIKSGSAKVNWSTLNVGQLFEDQCHQINLVIEGIREGEKALVCWADNGPYLDRDGGGTLVIRLLSNEEIEFCE